MKPPIDVEVRAWNDHSYRGFMLQVIYGYRDRSVEKLHVLQFQDDPDGATTEWFAFEERDPNELLGPPPFILSEEAAGALMNMLWQAGVRPSEQLAGQGAEGALSATEVHLADMRRLVFDPPKHLAAKLVVPTDTTP